MNEKHELFIREYLKDFNGTRAYKEVYGCSDDVARTNASRLLANANIQQAIQAQANKQLEAVEIDVNDILRELKAIAFVDRTKISRNVRNKILEQKEDGTDKVYYEDNVIFTETNELDDETRKVIAGYKKTQSGFAVETYDKMKALELLGKYMGIFKDKIEVSKTADETIKEVENYINAKRSVANE